MTLNVTNGLRRGALAAALLAGLAACGRGEAPAAREGAASRAPAAIEEAAVNVYSNRHYDSDLELFNAFTAETGIKVNLIEAGGDDLIERMTREGAASPADIFLTADAGVLWRAEDRGLLRAIEDRSVLERAPAQFRHPEGRWVGLSKRARIIIYNKEQGLPEGFDSYADLADPAYANTICVRSSGHVYNQSLLASIVSHDGAAAAEAWARGVVANLARKPQGNDSAQIEAVAAGICRFGIVNSYYVARFLDPSRPDQFAIGQKIGVLFPNQETTGAHVNISGAGVLAHAPHPKNAETLIGFLLRDESQRVFARGNNEYPVVAGVEPEGPIRELGAFRADTLDVAEYGRGQAEAVRIFDRAGWQ